MEPVFVDPNSEFDNEFILVQISNHKVSYRDHQVNQSAIFSVVKFSKYINS